LARGKTTASLLQFFFVSYSILLKQATRNRSNKKPDKRQVKKKKTSLIPEPGIRKESTGQKSGDKKKVFWKKRESTAGSKSIRFRTLKE